MSMQALIGHGLAHGASQAFHPFVSAVSQVSNYLAPLEVPDVNALIDMHIRGWISDKTLSQTAALQGVNIDPSQQVLTTEALVGNDAYKAVWNTAYYAHAELPALSEYLTIANRQFLSDERVASSLRRWGFLSETYRDWVTNLHWEIPGSSDLVRFSVRHVFEPDLIAKLGYNDEFNPYLDFWHKLQGLNYPIRDGPFEKQWQKWYATLPPEEAGKIKSYQVYGLEPPTWAQAFWWSHWVLPSPTQGYLMWARLNPNRDRSFDAPEMEGLNFSLSDLQLLLRANDYPPYYRDALAAISRPIPGIRFVREFRRTGVYDYADLVQWALRQNYSPRDAQDIARDIEEATLAKEKIPAVCRGCNVIEQAYLTGVIDRTAMIEQFIQYGLDDSQAVERADHVELELQTKRAKEFVSAIRRQYLLGDITEVRARNLLTGYGLVQTRIDEYLTDWTLEQQTRFKQISAQKSIDWACKGLITPLELSNRLTNLHYQPDDVQGMMSEAAYCASQLAARRAAAASRAERQRIADLKRGQREAAQIIRDAQRALSSHGSPPQLRKWFCEGHIAELDVYGRLRKLGWPDDDITRLLDDCKSGRKPTLAGTVGPTGP